MARKAYWILVLATLAVYAVMVLWSLPRIAEAAGGLLPFDLRPGGYGFDEARAFLTALTTDGSDFYLRTQHRLDAAYPAMLAATLAIGIYLSSRGLPRWIPALFAAAAIAGAGFDYLENLRVSALLRAGADGITPDLVAAASFATLAKSALSAVAMTALLALLLRLGWRRWRR